MPTGYRVASRAAEGDSDRAQGRFDMITIGTIILTIVVAGILWLVWSLSAERTQNRLGRRSPALDALEQRYASGEIDRDEYLQKKRDLGG
jgi:putative membrane protein